MDLKAGIFLHLTSLPSKYGVGNIGKSARDFVKILKQKGFKYWQFCPLTPTGFGDSPYQALSSFALNPYFLDLDELVEFNILSSNDLSPLLDLSKTQVEFGKLYFLFEKIKDKIFQNVSENFSLLEKYGDFKKFKKENEFWLKPWSYFISIKNSKSGQDWINWEEIQLKDYKKALKCQAIKDLYPSILREEILQFLLYFQFLMRGVELMILRIGVPLACVGLLDNDKGIFAHYNQMFMKAMATTMIQVCLLKLGLALVMNIDLLTGIGTIIMALKTPTFVREFMVQTSGGVGLNTIYHGSRLVSMAKALKK